MSQFYLIGGGPNAGKTTVARMISERFGIRMMRGDDLVGPHQKEAARQKYPINNYIESLKKKEQALELIKLTSNQEMARQEELFFMLLKELRSIQFAGDVLIEGNFLLPKLVKKRFEWPYTAVWLLPTKKFQEKLYPQQKWIQKLIKQDENPKLTLTNLIQRDKEFNQKVKRQARLYRLPYKVIDGNKPIEATFEWVLKRFGFDKGKTPVNQPLATNTPTA